jgi:hypothetical protein
MTDADWQKRLARIIEPREAVWEGFSFDEHVRERAYKKAGAIIAEILEPALSAQAQEIAELRGKVEGLDDAKADSLRLHREKMALFDRLLDLAGTAKAVVDATEQLADGTWMITGDGEALICALASELQRHPDIARASSLLTEAVKALETIAALEQTRRSGMDRIRDLWSACELARVVLAKLKEAKDG